MCELVPCLGAHGLGLLLASQLPSNEPWYCAHGWSLLVHRALCPYAVHRHLGASQLSLEAIRPWHCAHGFISWLTAQGLSALVPARGGGRLQQALCRCGHGVHTTHVVEPMCACSSCVVCLKHAQGRAMVPPWCDQGFPWWLPPLSHLPPLKEQYELFSLFLNETSICLRRHNGITNNYKLKLQVLQPSSALPKSGARARSPFGVHAMHVWLARSARAVRV